VLVGDRSRELLRRALDAIEAASDEYQQQLNAMAQADLPAGATGPLLRLARTVDALEGCASRLAAILDQLAS